MKAWGAVVTAAVLTVGTAWAASDDNAKPRGGGGSSSAGERHHSGGDSGSSKSSGSSSSSFKGSSGGKGSSSSSGSGFRDSGRTPTGAQLRHPRAGTGTGFRDRFFRGRNYYYYDPFWSSYGFYGYSWYSPFYFGPYYGGYYGYDPYPRRGYGYGYRTGSVRVLVEPKQTRVYVDGYYAGIADDFDGIFQRLNLAPGRHDISLRLDGFRTNNVKLYVPYEGTIKLHHQMVRGSGEEDAGVVGRPEDYARFEGRGDGRYEDDEDDEDYERDDRDLRADQDGERALVRLDVRPGDASVYVDGAFRGTARDLRQLRLVAGRHRIEVVRPGYRTVERDVEVRRGQTLDVDIDLDRS
jgi:hypothetical protein